MQTETEQAGGWHALADRVLAGGAVTGEEALAMLRVPDEGVLDLLAAAYRIRRRYFGNKVHLQRAERPLPRGLPLLFAVEAFNRRD